MRSLRNRAATGVVWTMIPLVLISGFPRIGCVCATGQHKLLCERLFRPKSNGDHEAASHVEKCSCCHHADPEPSAVDPATTSVELAPSCCAESDRLPIPTTRDSTGATERLASGRSCTPEVAAPLLAPVVDRVATPDQAAADFIAAGSEPSDARLPAATLETPWRHRIPLPDRVLIFQVLVI